MAHEEKLFSGNIFIFHAFDIGEDIDLEKVQTESSLTSRPLTLPKYFKNYHIPLAVELPHPHTTSHCISTKLHSFGAVSLTYKIPFESTFDDLRKNLQEIDNKYQEQSVSDTGTLFKKIKQYLSKPKFFYTKSSYLVIQVDTQESLTAADLKKEYGSTIASALRFETESLSEYLKNTILQASIGYYKEDLILIDTDAAFVYDADFEETLGFFEFANIQQLELRFFDRLLDQQLNIIYEEKTRKVPLKSYLPFVGSLSAGPVDDLGKLKVDISVITERLENSIKVVGEPFFSELYELLVDKLDLKNWKDTIDKKLSIIHDIRSVLQHKIDSVREDLLTMLIIILICIELIVAILQSIH